MPQGASPVSNAINLGQEKFVGIRIIVPGTGLTAVKLQALVAGNLGDTATEVWSDIEIVLDDGSSVNIIQITGAPPPAGLYIFARDKAGYVPPVVRLAGVGTLATANLTARILSDPHS